MEILAILFLVAAVVAFIFVVVAVVLCLRMRDIVFAGVGFFFFLLATLSYGLGIDCIQDGEEEKMISEIKENADDWTFYLDGQEVSFGSISIDQYDVSYDTEQNKVFLTKE